MPHASRPSLHSTRTPHTIWHQWRYPLGRYVTYFQLLILATSQATTSHKPKPKPKLLSFGRFDHGRELHLAADGSSSSRIVSSVVCYAVLCPWSGGLCGLLFRFMPWSGGRVLYPAISRLIRVQVRSSRVQFGTKNDVAGYALAKPRHIRAKCGAGQSAACVYSWFDQGIPC